MSTRHGSSASRWFAAPRSRHRLDGPRRRSGGGTARFRVRTPGPWSRCPRARFARRSCSGSLRSPIAFPPSAPPTCRSAVASSAFAPCFAWLLRLLRRSQRTAARIARHTHAVAPAEQSCTSFATTARASCRAASHHASHECFGHRAEPRRSSAAEAPLRRIPRLRFPHRKFRANWLPTGQGRRKISHHTRLWRSRLRGSHVHPFQGLPGTNDPFRALEIVGPSVYRCDMRELSSPGVPATPPVPDRHARDTRRSRDRYTGSMRAASSYRGRLSMTGMRAACAGLSAASASGAGRSGRVRCGLRLRARPLPLAPPAGARRFSACRVLQIGAANMPDVAPPSGIRRPTSPVRHPDCPSPGAAAALSRWPVRVRT